MKRRMIIYFILISTVTTAALVAGVMVQQAFTGDEVERIAAVHENASSRQIISLQGRITNYSPAENTFILTDESGSLELRTCPAWYKKIRLQNGEHVTISGHIVPTKASAPKALYVFTAHTIKRPSGAVITVRDSIGKPPWTSGRRSSADR